jgi:hypothetical protein
MLATYHYFFQTGSTGPFTNVYVSQSAATGNTDHEVTIIGWNDDFVVPASAGGGVSGTGAWLVQNSWGTGSWCDTASGTNDGTFWASYNDAAIGRSGVAAFTMRPALAGQLPVLQNEVGPIAVGYADYAAPTLPTELLLETNQQVVVQLAYSDPAAVPVVVGPDVINFTAVGETAVRSGLSFSLATSGSWLDMAGLTFKNESVDGRNGDGGILFAKGVVAVPEPGTFAAAAIGVAAVAWSYRRSRRGVAGRAAGETRP